MHKKFHDSWLICMGNYRSIQKWVYFRKIRKITKRFIVWYCWKKGLRHKFTLNSLHAYQESANKAFLPAPLEELEKNLGSILVSRGVSGKSVPRRATMTSQGDHGDTTTFNKGCPLSKTGKNRQNKKIEMMPIDGSTFYQYAFNERIYVGMLYRAKPAEPIYIKVFQRKRTRIFLKNLRMTRKKTLIPSWSQPRDLFSKVHDDLGNFVIN